MLFHTTQFAVFFVIVFGLYLISNHKWQNRMLLVASYVFFGSWNWKYLSLILFSTIVDYFCGISIDNQEEKSKKKRFVYLSIIVNLGLLCTFKYYDFFALEFKYLMENFGISVKPYFLNVILPIGISFYTFQTISYTVDVYRGKLKACKHFLDFALYVSFFPQLVAGPIERGVRLLPQILEPRKVTKEKITHGLYMIFLGLFLKVVIADNLADIVDPIFNTATNTGSNVFIATYSFAIQIFCDFAGYSFMAIGLAAMMGITLMDNFKRPYLSLNISEFWRRWHISLSSWFRDYCFSPFYIYLQKTKKFKKFKMKTRHQLAFFITLFITEFLLGLWHGAGWNYAMFGIYHAIMIMAYYYGKKYYDKMPALLQIFVNFQIACIGWLIFRSDSFSQSWEFFTQLFTNWDIYDPYFIDSIKKFSLLAGVLIIYEAISEIKNEKYIILLAPKYIQHLIYTCIFVLMILFGQFGEKKFIYFQF
jgi:alginate O-acetyltransferase complex protein AlgI